MPILPAEPNVFPEDLLGGSVELAADSAWRVAYTKPRNEKALARDLVVRHVPFYLPLVPKQLRSRGRILKSLVPLFAGYVFICATEEQRVESLKTNRISRIIDVDDQAVLLAELQNHHHSKSESDRAKPGTR